MLPRPEEALAVKTDQGEPAEDAEDGYDLKGEQTTMILTSRNLPAGGLEFFNVREDDLQRLNGFLVARVKHLRELHIKRLDEVIAEANALVENFEIEQKSEILRDAAHRLQIWIEGNQELQTSPLPLEKSLINAMGEVYASSVRASVRRLGEWDKLDYSHQMGFGARVKAIRAVTQNQLAFKANVKTMLDDSEMEEAHGLVSQVQRLFDSGIESLLKSSQQMERPFTQMTCSQLQLFGNGATTAGDRDPGIGLTLCASTRSGSKSVATHWSQRCKTSSNVNGRGC